MALFVRQNDNRSELQSKVAAELQEKLHARDTTNDPATPEPHYADNQHTTRTAGIIIGLLVLVGIVLLLYITTLAGR